MNTKAKKLSVFLAILATPWGLVTVGLAGRASWHYPVSKTNAAQENDAAYRDGLFLGKLDGQQGRKVRPSIGRWNTEKDRASFSAGYEKGYREALASRSGEHRR